MIGGRSAKGGTRTWPPGRARTVGLFAAGLALVAGCLSWILIPPAAQLRRAAALLADAYTRERPFEWRFVSTSYAPLRPEGRKHSAFSRPVALLEAESLIARRLAQDPDSAAWLRMRARAEMLERKPESAIVTLQHALEWQPDAPDLLADLGVAYGLRADAQNRDVDFAYAIDYLGRSLKASPNSPVTIFNRAIVYERMYLYDDAVSEWRQYVDLEPAGPWRDEARRRLTELERTLEARQRILAQNYDKNPELLLRRLDTGLEVEAENYLNVAVIHWLPRRKQDERYERALSALATRFEKQHGDRWLRDLLASRASSQSTRGLAALSEAVQANLADESDRALAKSDEAADRLQAAGNRPGTLRADFERTLALHRAVRSAAGCVEEAATVESGAAARGYTWIAGQALIEQGNCRSLLGDFGAAQNDLARALEMIRRAGYRDLELRAAGILADIQTEVGNLLIAWTGGRIGLAKYWNGSYSGSRAQQMYFNLTTSAQGLGLRQASYVFAGATAAAIAQTPARRTEATTRAYLAELAMKAGWPSRAKVEFDRASSLFDRLQDTGPEYRTRAELYHAQAEIASGAPRAALERLEAIRPSAESLGAALVRIGYEQVRADALRLSGRADEAEAAYRQTITSIEDQLSTLRGFRDRAQLLIVADKAYRGLLELLWGRGDLSGAWHLWERFRASARQGLSGELDLDQRRERLGGESFLSYVILPGAVLAWVFDDRGIEGWRLKIKPEDVESVASRFVRECADPASDQHSLLRDGRLLYDGLVEPVARRLDPARTLVIEPDGAVGSIPIQALIDPSFHYVGERFAITVAGGLVDYQIRAAAGSVTPNAKALVVADPRLGEKMTRTYPPLADAMTEGRSIASRFHRPVLLTGAQATFAALEQYGPETELFHFVGHGFSNAGNGGLLLSPGDRGTEEAGVLDANALARQDWSRCRLAVLSACSTGTGEAKGPVNPESLVRGLLWAGVARVVASYWNTDSETGVPFMDRFYTDLRGGTEVAVALQRAAKSLRENKATSHPYYWAAFQSFGTR